jgi:hypothetical protein
MKMHSLICADNLCAPHPCRHDHGPASDEKRERRKTRRRQRSLFRQRCLAASCVRLDRSRTKWTLMMRRQQQPRCS